MQVKELEEYLTQFLKVARQSEADFNAAVANEQYYEDATQDILHAGEFAPSMFTNIDLDQIINTIRTERRDAKKELEGATIWKEWAIENKKAFDKLEQVIGRLRKVIKWQSNSFYNFKTDILKPHGSTLVADSPPTPEHEQLSLF